MEENYLPTVALIYGGRGYESDVSVRGAEWIMPFIDRRKYRMLSIFIDKDGRWLSGGGEATPAYLNGVSGILLRGEMIPISCAIPLLHGDFGEDGIVQGALENAKIPYIGCKTCAGAICIDKALTKTIATRLGIPTLPWVTADCENDALEAEKALKYPLFIKPCSLGSSVGVSKATNRDELLLGVRTALEMDNRVIIEKALSRPRELECGYYKANCKEIFTNPGEIICKSEFYDYDKKYISTNDVSVLPTAHIDEETQGRIKNYSLLLVKAIGVRQLCRLDFFLCDEGLYFNEINTMPGFTPDSLYHKMLSASGIEPKELVESLIWDTITNG